MAKEMKRNLISHSIHQTARCCSWESADICKNMLRMLCESQNVKFLREIVSFPRSVLLAIRCASIRGCGNKFKDLLDFFQDV